jgi:hypothetical protein
MQPPPDRVTDKPDWLGGLDLDGLIGLSLSSAPEPHPAAGWQAPSSETLAEAFPQYEILELLGRGGMGAVYLARHRSLDRRVALKLLPGEFSGNEKFVQRFHREARALARLQHPNIVAVHDFGSTVDGLLYFAMEHVAGSTLAERLRDQRPDVAGILAIAGQICDALAYAHEEGIVHRDIKPSNILLDARGRVKVADFGLAKVAMEAHPSVMEGAMFTRTGVAMGTPEYAAPEQMSGMDQVDHRADLFSLGVLLHEMLTGQVPRGVFDPPSRKSGTDPRFDPIVLRAMQEHPDRRYSSAAEMKAALVPLALPPTLTVTQEDGSKRGLVRRMAAFLLIVAVFAGLGAMGYWMILEKAVPDPGVSSPAKPAIAVEPAPPVPKPLTATFRGREYRFVAGALTWAAANDAAVAAGGRLSIVTDAETSQFLSETFAREATGGIFLGGHCWRPGGEWEWSTGEAWRWSAWKGAPPLFGALLLTPDGSWEAVGFDEARPFVIETDSGS